MLQSEADIVKSLHQPPKPCKCAAIAQYVESRLLSFQEEKRQRMIDKICKLLSYNSDDEE